MKSLLSSSSSLNNNQKKMTAEDFTLTSTNSVRLDVETPFESLSPLNDTVGSPLLEASYTDMLDIFPNMPVYSPVLYKDNELPAIVAEKEKTIQQPAGEIGSGSVDRRWVIITSNLQLNELSVKMKTRKDPLSEFIPDPMFSSLKYELHLFVSGPSIAELPYLFARVSIADSETLNKTPVQIHSAALTGVVEVSMSKSPSGPVDTVKGILKIQVNSELSFHHHKKLLCLLVEFFEPKASNSPVAVMRSASVKCYARKPNKPKKSVPISLSVIGAAKRKTQEEPPKVKKKRSESNMYENIAFVNFKQKLDDLMEVNATYREDIRYSCFNYLFQKILNSGDHVAHSVATQFIHQYSAMHQQTYFIPQAFPLTIADDEACEDVNS
jgi:hypothetical protein